MKAASLVLLLLLTVLPTVAQTGMSNDEIVEKLIAGRPKGKRVLVPPALFDTLDDKSYEQNALTTDLGLAAWRDIYGKSGNDEFAMRQFFVPLKAWSLKKPPQMLDDARNQMVDGKQTVLVSEKDFVLDDCPGRTFVIRDNATGTVMRLDYVLMFPDLYILSYTGTAEGLKQPKVAKFFADLKTEPVK